jgi:methyltransferase FkbM-like protein
MNFGKYQLKRCRYGWMLFAGPYIGKCFELYGEYSEAEVSVIRAFVPARATAVDVGANIGDLTLPMSRCAAEAGRIYAIESHIEHYHVLCANLALNGIRSVKALNCFVAATDNPDTSGPWGEFGYISQLWGTTIIPLDALQLDACSFIKIDVDGKELDVLKSGQTCIDRHRPVIYFENDMREASPALLDHVLNLGYDIYWHPAPIFAPDNFFGNPVNHWHPRNILSLMMLAIPKETNTYQPTLRKVASKDDWWE